MGTQDGLKVTTGRDRHSSGTSAKGNLGEQKAGQEPAATLPRYFKPYWTISFLVTALVAILVIWCFCWLYVGAFWNPQTRLRNLHLLLLDCDTVPPAASLNASFAPLLQALAPAPVATTLLGASVYNPSNLLSSVLHWDTVTCPGVDATATGGRPCGTPEQEAQCVQHYADDVLDCGPWGLLYFPSNITSGYLSWFPGSGISPPTQQPAAGFYYARGRDYSTHNYLFNVVLTALLPGISRAFVSQLAASAQVMQIINPGFLATGISVNQFDLAPVNNFGQNFASYVFCILLWLGSCFVVATSYQYKLPVEVQLIQMANRRRSSFSKSLKATSPNSSPRTASGTSPSAAAPPPPPPPMQKERQPVAPFQDGQNGQLQPAPPPPPLPPPPPPPPPRGQPELELQNGQKEQQAGQQEQPDGTGINGGGAGVPGDQHPHQHHSVLPGLVEGQEGQQGQLDGHEHHHHHHGGGPRALVEETMEVVGSTRFRCVVWTVVVKGVVSTLYMFVLMVLLCCVLWALGRGTEQWHLSAGYAIAYGWFLSWAFVSINAVLLHALGIERFSSMSALLLILQLTSASAIMTSELSNRFFYVGKAFPFYYGVRAFRTIFFGACEPDMYINWLVAMAYNVVMGPLGVALVAHKLWRESMPGAAVGPAELPGTEGVVGNIVLPVGVV